MARIQGCAAFPETPLARSTRLRVSPFRSTCVTRSTAGSTFAEVFFFAAWPCGATGGPASAEGATRFATEATGLSLW